MAQKKITGVQLDVTDVTASLNAFTTSLKGLAPASGGGTTNYLRADGTWAAPLGSGTVTSVSVTSANGFAGTVATATTTPAITISTSITGLVKGNGTAISAATAGTDYSAGTSALATGILKSTTSTGALTIAVAADFPTLNQNTTGTASNVTGTVAVTNGGTGTTTSFTTGSVVFAGASGVYSQDNANFFWDDTNNRLGIGTTGPSYKLHASSTGSNIIGSQGTTDASFITNVNGTQALYMHSTATSSEINELRALPLLFTVNGAERMRIDASGGLIVGANSFSGWVSRAKIKQGNSTKTGGIVIEASSNTAGISIGHTGTAGYIGSNFGSAGDSYTPLIFQTSDLDRLAIDTSGNVGIGTSSITTGAKLDLRGMLFQNSIIASTPSNQHVFNANGNNYPAFYDAGLSSTSGGLAIGGTLVPATAPTTPTMFWNVNTNVVGIGTNAPAATLDTRTSTGAIISAGRTSNVAATSEPGYFDITAPNASGTAKTWGRIYSVVGTATAGAEASSLIFMSQKAGTLSEAMRIGPTGILTGIGKIAYTGTSTAGVGYFKGTGTQTDSTVKIELDDQAGTNNAFKITNLTNWAQSGAFVSITAANGTDTGALISLTNAGSGNYLTCDSIASITKSGNAKFANVATNAPITKTGNFTVGVSEGSYVCNGGATITVTLPSASTFSGRWIYIKTIAAFTVVSASSNVLPITSAAAGTAILAATAGKWAALQSNGTNWVIMMAN